MRASNILLVLLTVLVTSCDSKAVFDEYKSVSTAWNKEDIVSFNINAPDSIKPYNLFVNIRNTNAYKFSNLYLIVEMNFPHGKTLTDTLEYEMTKKNGEWLGEGLTAVKENKLWYKEGVVFNESGTYTVNIQHAMRNNGEVNGVVNLEGITDVGFRVEKIE
ncbi:gliding motility lipoprotein GldH [Olleya aquimaris]|uniref:Gliding motility-associated lipoprotein GldH n=1 Tax=Olleya aquimaris TaxID=639310 RepID=A0A327RNS0_9FLAO|nr:gliding motility lipoprotein GldH [Olleya aquimaris]RAJ17955.1 gliding motility-associated lipoprotein GldH [Olleya aquimaris]